MRGKVVWFDQAKGYGFLQPERTEEGRQTNVFVHYSDIIKVPRQRQTLFDCEDVEFDVEETPKGRKAKNVKRLQWEK